MEISRVFENGPMCVQPPSSHMHRLHDCIHHVIYFAGISNQSTAKLGNIHKSKAPIDHSGEALPSPHRDFLGDRLLVSLVFPQVVGRVGMLG